MILGIHHIMVSVPLGAEDQARRFYCDILGFREIEKPASLAARGGVWLECAEPGGQQIHIGPEDGVDRRRTRAHIAYHVTDLAYWRAVADREKLNVLESIPLPGYDRFECRDPFGNRVEFIQSL